MIKLSIYILTSKNEKLVLRGMESIFRQINHPFEVRPIVMVNSMNENYFKSVGDALDPVNFGITDHPIPNSIILNGIKNLICLQSESNGKPGKGKNACIDHFISSDGDYMMLIDGDDFLYPTALQMLARAIKDEPDVVCGCAQDHLQSYNPVIVQSWGNHEPNLAVTNNRDIYRKNEYNLWHQFSIDRLFLLKNKFLQTFDERDGDWFYDDMDLYEDFVFTINLTAIDCKYLRVNNSFIYCYDAVEQGQCSMFESNPELANKNMELFWDRVGDVLDAIDHRPIKFSDTPFLKLGSPFNFSHQDKYGYIKELNTMFNI